MLFAADAPAVSASTTLAIAIVSGIVSIVVGFLGYLGVKHKQVDAPPVAPVAEPPRGSDEEPMWVKELRKDVSHKEIMLEHHDKEIERLHRMLYLAGIDPITGEKLQKGTGS